MLEIRMFKVIVSNGVFRFHLVAAAMEAARRGALDIFVTGAYPKGRFARYWLANFGKKSARLARFFDRASESVPDERVVSIWSAELLIQAGVIFGRIFGLHEVNERLQGAGLQIYGRLACCAVERSNADIYHFRAGYGGRSVALAKAKGMLCLCDHSVVSPLVFDFMVENGGKLPDRETMAATKLSPMWKRVLADIEAADHILANSELVRTTLICHRIPRRKISVIYQGLDEKFIAGIPREISRNGPGHLLFAGEVSRRKGFDVIIQALEKIPSSEWVLTVAGNVNEKATQDYSAFLRRENVRHAGFVSREALAELMVATPIFLFPSLAEGSARVVFEALACGCYVITTPNAGSVVEDGRHGSLVKPGDPHALQAAILAALANPSRVQEVGASNRSFVRTHYGQSSYGDQLDALYKRLLGHADAVLPHGARVGAVSARPLALSDHDPLGPEAFSTAASLDTHEKEQG
ncbi:glycosyltransferase family 4 protein [Paraburkholderia xenovorans]|uniref:glycosyltransferase n=1 Tax=Paraburkholderia xenovorans TaxID=36873 RepID=UPI0038B88823